MRVIAGQYRRRTLRSLPGLEIRPTADRLRETLFNVLCAGDPAALAESAWLDLYAGTGAVGIETLSRGARMVYFIESSKAAAELIAANLKSLGIADGFQVLKVEAGKALRQLEVAGCVADFVFLDPPYSMQDEYAKTLAALAQSKLLGERSVVIAEHEKRFDPGDAFGELRQYRKLVQGDAALSFYRRQIQKLRLPNQPKKWCLGGATGASPVQPDGNARLSTSWVVIIETHG
jgi:16S rRNA (guanine(966)-N(2))-methyltransferase RsmD